MFHRAFVLLSIAIFAFFGLNCGGSTAARDESAAAPRRTEPRPAPHADAATARVPADVKRAPKPAGTPRIIVLGDSLTAGLGLDLEQSFPSIIQERLDRDGYNYEVVNAGVSGDTSAGGLRRLEWALTEGAPQILIVALGGNDGLRGLPPAELQKNLTHIIDRATSRGLKVVLTGMEAPPNFGEDYTNEFRQVYRTLAAKYRVPFVPFLLEGVAGKPELNQADGIHPNTRGARVVADLVWQALEPGLTRPTEPSR
jgi:acyl-CoA thioesterase-1